MPSIQELELDLLEILLRGGLAGAVTEAQGEAYREAEQWLLDPERRISGVNAMNSNATTLPVADPEWATNNSSAVAGTPVQRPAPLSDFQALQIAASVDMEMSSDLSLLDGAVAQVTETIDRAARWGDTESIGLAVREAIANAIVHGNNCDPAKTVRVSTSVNEDCDLLITVKDSGSGFDPSRIANPTAEPNLLSDHGRGIFLIKQFMDQVDFKFDHGTEVCMRKRRKNSHVVLGSPNSPSRRGRLKRASRGPAQDRRNVAEGLSISLPANAVLVKEGQHAA